MKTLAIDHGRKRLGIAISDPSGRIARPLKILKHVSRDADAAQVLEIAQEAQASVIVVGQATQEDGTPNPAGRSAARFAETLRTMTTAPVVLWDESLSTQDARQRRLSAGASRKRRATAVDALAAAVILQSYLDAHEG